MKTRDTGNLGERLGRNFLAKRGFQIIETNYRSPGGEIDIIARQGEWLVFVEVRTKRSRNFGTPEESITQRKKAKLVAVAEHYLQNHEPQPKSWRIDLVAVELDNRNRASRIELTENAVSEEQT